MKKILGILTGLLLISLLFHNCQKSDFSIITGVVRDSITSLPLQGVDVTTGDGHNVKTDVNGNFTLNGGKTGKVTFSVVYLNGYYPKTQSCFISGDRVTKVDIALKHFEDPEIETGMVNSLTFSSASITAKVNIKPGIPLNYYGHCWSSSNALPTYENCSGRTEFYGSSGQFSFTSYLSGLSPDNVYYVRAYIKNNAGYSYGNTVVFKTNETDITDGLISYLPFNNNFSEQTGTTWGSYFWNESFTTDRFGNSNYAITFPNPSYWAYNYSTQFTSFNQFSFSFWFNKSSWAGAERLMVGNAYPTMNNIMRVGEDASTNKLYFRIKTSSGNTYSIGATTAPSLNSWHHVAAVRNNTSILLYVDGILQGSASCDNQPIILDYYGWGYGFMWYGQDYYYGNSYQNGSLDDVRIYNRALTNSEIKYLKNH